VQIAGRDFELGGADVAQALLTAQAHELVERSALGGTLARITPSPAPEEALLAVHTEEYPSGCASRARAVRGTASTHR
jgi:acetoin utilization deacetylase AcuC-like enzyme